MAVPQDRPPAAKAPARAKEITAAGRAEIRRFANMFGAALPPGCNLSGQYVAKEDDRFAGETLDVPDGVYRVYGHDWLITIRRGKFMSAARAVPHAENNGVVHVGHD